MLKLISALVLSSVLFACGGGKHFWAAQPVSGPVTVQPEEVWAHGGKLWVRVVLVNGTAAPIVVDRDQMVARLPNGAIVHRAQGTYTQHTPYEIPPGASHPVYVEFPAEGWDWRDVPGAQIDFSAAVTSNGQPMPVPVLTVANAP
ncbi:MAG TPA: hypothetical protein VGH87_07005 [Polyangiaceae bacterium]|jgi:hypothetical protein